MKLCKQILLLMLVIQIFVGQFAVLALPDDVSAQEGTPETKVFLNEMFLRHLSMPDGTTVRKSGWDLGVTGGSVADTAGLQLLDTSNTLPVTAEHQLESIDSGKVTLEINFRVGRQIPGAEISMRHGMTPVLQLQFTDTGVSFVDAWGQQKSLFSIYPQYPWVYYDVRVIADFDTGLADVYHENALVASKLLFARHMSVDNVYISTGEQAVGNLNLSTVRIYKGYPLWEDGNWELDNDGIGWTFETVNHSCVFESQLLIPNQDGETQISIRLHDKDILTLNADTKAFYVSSDTRPISAFYEYQKNVWYILRAEFNMLHQTADIKLNGRYVVRDIPVSADGIDSIVITSSHAEAKAGYAKLFYQQLPNDYVPPPNKVSSTEYLIGMQSFPMFTEGTSVGWDWINDAPGRKPLLGFYDGQLPETADWTIKWLAEHGIDYQWFVWHQFAQLGQPVQYSGEDPTVQDGYMHAKYADILKYGILWENASSNIYGSDRAANRESFLAYTVPYWLEYFLKDSRYVQLNGRPLIGIYSYSTLASAFGSPSEIKQLFDSFREMCSQNGVGDPIIVQHVAAGTSEAAIDEMYQSGIDAVYMYAQGDPYPEAQADANAGLCANAKNMQYIPSFTMGYDAFAWGRGTNVKLTGGQFYECLQHAKDNLLPDLPNRIGGTKKPVMLTTWDEFGEGHYLCPTEAEGFLYLDIVRDVFIGGNHTDTVPNAAQKDRINTLYPKERVTTVQEAVVSTEIPEGANLIQAWNFSSGDIQDWMPEIGSSVTTTGDALFLRRSADTGIPAVQISNLQMDINDVTHIKIRLRNTSDSYYGILNYRTAEQPAYDGNKRISFPINQTGDEQEIILPVAKYPTLWNGILLAMRLEFQTSTPDEGIYLSAVELWGKHTVPPSGGGTLYVNARKCIVPNLLVHSGKLYVPLNICKDLLGISDYRKGEELAIKSIGGRVAQTSIGCSSITVEGQEWQTKETAVLEKNGTLYLSPAFIAFGMHNRVVSDLETRTLTISRLGDLETGYDGEGIVIFSNPPHNSRNINLTTDVTITFSGQLAMDTVSTRTVTVNGNADLIEAIVPKGANAFTIQLKELAPLTRYTVRMDGVVCGTAPVNQAVTFTTGTGTETVGWEFDGADDLEFAAGGTGYNDIFVTDGTMCISWPTEGVRNIVTESFSLSAEDVPVISMAMQSDVSCNAMLYFLTDTDNAYTAQKRFAFSVTKSDTFVPVIIDTSENALWTGNITQIRLDFYPVTPTEVKIDYVRMHDCHAEACQVGSMGFYASFNTPDEELLGSALDGAHSEVSAVLSGFQNNMETPMKIWLLAAAYATDDERLLGSQIKEVTVPAFTSLNEPVVVPIGNTPPGSVTKLFLWNEYLKPYNKEMEE